MDTIIYLYHSRKAENYSIEKWQEKEYCLIRLGIPMLLWRNLKSLEKALEQDEAAEQSGRRKRRRRWWRREEILQAKRERSEESLQKEQAQQKLHALQKVTQPFLAELSELQTVLRLLGAHTDCTYCVYENFLMEKIDTRLWWEHWSLPHFSEYHEWIWAEELMKYAALDSFLILGYAPCVEKILNWHGVKMRSVKWILKPEQYTEAVREFVDCFYEEFGLAISLQLLGEGEGWIRFRPCTIAAVNVLDFTGEEKLSACDVAEGSLWLDMNSLEGKEWRMENRCPHITYFSLKKQWKQLEKAPFYLDTTGKNRYNT